MASAVAVALVTVFKWALVACISFGLAYRLVSAWFERELAAWETVALLGGLFGIAVLAIKLSNSPWFFILLGGAGLVMLLLRAVPGRLAKQRRRQMLEDDISRYQGAIQFDPRNIAAYSFLADAYFKLGEIDRAIECYRKSLEIDPKQTEEKKKLERALREKWMREGSTMFCPRCFQPRLPKHDECLDCGRAFRLHETLAFNLRRAPRASLLVWAAGAVGALVLMLAFTISGYIAFAVLIGLALIATTVMVLRPLAKWE